MYNTFENKRSSSHSPSSLLYNTHNGHSTLILIHKPCDWAISNFKYQINFPRNQLNLQQSIVILASTYPETTVPPGDTGGQLTAWRFVDRRYKTKDRRTAFQRKRSDLLDTPSNTHVVRAIVSFGIPVVVGVIVQANNREYLPR